jgi:hypothetical protein
MAEVFALVFLGAIGTGLFFVLRWYLRICWKGVHEVRDCIWVVRAGVPNPIELRHQFIQDMGREPTIAEVKDLHEMLQAEHDKARNGLLAVGGGIVGVFMLFHRELHK